MAVEQTSSCGSNHSWQNTSNPDERFVGWIDILMTNISKDFIFNLHCTASYLCKTNWNSKRILLVPGNSRARASPALALALTLACALRTSVCAPGPVWVLAQTSIVWQVTWSQKYGCPVLFFSWRPLLNSTCWRCSVWAVSTDLSSFSRLSVKHHAAQGGAAWLTIPRSTALGVIHPQGLWASPHMPLWAHGQVLHLAT